MGVETKKSQAITNRDATPSVKNPSHEDKSVLLESIGTIEVIASDASLSTLNFASVPSNARISQVLVSCDALGTSGTMDLGLYKSTQDGGDLVDQDFFGDAIALGSALSNSDVTHESGQFNKDEADEPLWEALGLTEDPNIYYDIVGTIMEAAEDPGTVSLKVRYCI